MKEIFNPLKWQEEKDVAKDAELVFTEHADLEADVESHELEVC